MICLALALVLNGAKDMENKRHLKKRLFTKSAFKQALTCPASLYYFYAREHYANQNNEDDFLQALADGGNQVGDLAKVYYEVKKDADIAVLDYQKAIDITAGLLKRDEVNIAEAAFRWGDCFVRADIIEKRGNSIKLIEVKAKSWSISEDNFVQARNPNRVSTQILPYVYDVAFQKYIIQNALGPSFKVTAHLMMADKDIIADIDGINQYFKVVKDDNRASIIREPGAENLNNGSHVLTAFDVDELCTRIIEGSTDEQMELMGCTFKEFVTEMSRQYVNHERHFSNVSDTCFKCPFFSNDKTPGMLDGKKECWMEMAGFSEDDFDRPQVAELWGAYIRRGDFIDEGKYFLEDLSIDDFTPARTNGPGLNHVERKLLQIGLSTGNEEMLAPFKKNLYNGIYVDVEGLKVEMSNWVYPLHMIDFETTAVALPFYEGMRPYEQVAFQFSHHIIERDGTIYHAGQYLNTEKHHFPNFDFVRELKSQLETDHGSVFRYAAHENSILRAIHKQLKESSEPDKEELMTFIDSITHYKEGKNALAGPRDMIDLLDIVKKYYYHPSMKGSNSIKVVLPAILNSSEAIQQKYEQPIYGSEIPSCNFSQEDAKAWISYADDGTVENPYKHLDTIASFLEVTPDELEEFDSMNSMDESIANGGAALAAYTKLQFADSVCTDAIAQGLLRYCELDTMSMVFIWEYFNEMICSKGC